MKSASMKRTFLLHLMVAIILRVECYQSLIVIFGDISARNSQIVPSSRGLLSEPNI